MSRASNGIVVLATTLCVMGLAPTGRADVLTVNGFAPAQFGTVAEALLAASDGDVILVTGEGVFAGVTIDGLSITLAADTGVFPILSGPLDIRNLGADQQVVVTGFTLLGQSGMGPAVTASNNSGPVWLEGCFLFGADQLLCGSGPTPGDGHAALRVKNNPAPVIVIASRLQGGQSASGECCGPCYEGGVAGPGLLVQNGVVDAYDSELIGGNGSVSPFAESLGPDGGPGAFIAGQGLFASNCQFVGGNGGKGFDFFPISGHGNGGTGLVIGSGSQARLLGNTYQGGAAGLSAFGVPGLPGLDLVDQGTTLFLPGVSRVTSASTDVAREGQIFTLSFQGEPGDLVLVVAGLQAEQHYQQHHYGVLLMKFPILLGPLGLGAIGPTGSLDVPVLVPDLGPGLEGVSVLAQGAMITAGGVRLASAAAVTFVDDSF